MEKKYTYDIYEIIINIKNLNKLLKNNNEDEKIIRSTLSKYKKLLYNVLKLYSCKPTYEEPNSLLMNTSYDTYLINKIQISFFLQDKFLNFFSNVKDLEEENIPTYKSTPHSLNETISEVSDFFNDLDITFFQSYMYLLNNRYIYFKNIIDIPESTTDLINETSYIYMPMTNTLEDTVALAHECCHSIHEEYLHYSFNCSDTYYLTKETISLLSSFLLTDYFESINYNKNEIEIEKKKTYNSMYNNINIGNKQLKLYNIFDRGYLSTYEFNIIFNDSDLREKDCILLSNYASKLKYAYSYFLAFELYLQYKHDKKEGLTHIKNFMVNSKPLELDNLCKIIDIDINSIGSEQSKTLLKEYINK